MPLAANVAQILEGRSRDPTADAETPTYGRLPPVLRIGADHLRATDSTDFFRCARIKVIAVA